jgi:Protein of unknown function (DUF1176)
MIKVLKTTAIIVLSSLLASVSHAQFNPQVSTQTYRDWSVTCNNVKRCMAYSTSTKSEGGLALRPRGASPDLSEGWMIIERAAGLNASAQILLSRPDLSSTSIAANSQIHLLGANGRVLPSGVFAATLGNRGAIQIAPSLNTTFLNVARTASHAVLVSGPVKRPVFFVSLSGLVASGRAIDAFQGRTNTAGALIDVGRRSNATVPAAPVLPVVTAIPFAKRTGVRPPAALLARRVADCDDGERFDPGGGNIEAFTLDRNRTLWSVPCGAGAYNTWNRFYIQPARGALVVALFTGKPVGDAEEAIGLMNASIDHAKGVITAFSKGRGLGDCGSAETYVWDGDVFQLAQLSEMVPCGGIISEFWPSVIESRVVVR